MNTRCKPGDLAIVVRNSTGVSCEGSIGAIIRCQELGLSLLGPAWRVKPRRCPACGGTVVGQLDADLDPIRPPAPDKAVDAPVPAEKVSA